MLFSEEEISQLKFCGEIARSLNIYYSRMMSNNQDKISNARNDSIWLDKEILFDKLKLNIQEFDGVILFGLSEKNKNILVDQFNRFNNIVQLLGGEVRESGDVEKELMLFILNIYKFIDELFNENGVFSDHLSNINFKDRAFRILQYFSDINERFSFGFQQNKTKIYDRLVLLEDHYRKLREEITENSNLMHKTVDTIVLENEKYFNAQLNDLIQGLRGSLTNIHNMYEEEVRGRVDSLKASVIQADQDFKSTLKDYTELKKIVNLKGEMTITDHYKNKAVLERITYWIMTLGTFAIIFFSINLAMKSLDEYKAKTNIPISTLIKQYNDIPVEKLEKAYAAQQDRALTYLLLRLALSILIFSTIIYTSRVAYRSYVHMRHSENMRLKLATLRPFINQLEKEDRNQIHKDLVPDYFGKDAGMVDSAHEKFKDLPANVSAVAMKAIEQISGSSNSSGTEKNGKKPEGGTE